MGWIVDILANPCSMNAFIRAIVEFFCKMKVQRIDCLISCKRYQRALYSNGFLNRRSEARLLAHGEWIQKNIQLTSRRENWFITAGDCDFER